MIGEADIRRIVGEVFASSPKVEDIREAFSSFMYLPDPTVVDVVLAAYVANQLDGDPVWLLVVGAPSRGKTELVSALGDMPDVHMLSKLTGQTFASGIRKDRSASLLFRMEDQGKRTLVLKDLTSVLTMNRDARDAVLSDLREIYDGQFNKEFGSGGSVTWAGKIGLLAGVTPVIDLHYAALSQLGDRWLQLRLPEVERQTLSTQALDRGDGIAGQRRQVREVVRAYLEGIEMPVAVNLSEEFKKAVVGISDLVTQPRTAVARDGYTREISEIPELEAPARFALELAGLGKALFVLGHAEDSALSLTRRVAADCIPPMRLALLRRLAKGSGTTSEIAVGLDVPTTARNKLQDLVALKLALRDKAGRDDMWLLSEQTALLFKKVDL